jgi:hypothetical protein
MVRSGAGTPESPVNKPFPWLPADCLSARALHLGRAPQQFNAVASAYARELFELRLDIQNIKNEIAERDRRIKEADDALAGWKKWKSPGSMCPPDTPDCGGDDCTAMAAALAKTSRSWCWGDGDRPRFNRAEQSHGPARGEALSGSAQARGLRELVGEPTHAWSSCGAS